MSPLNRFPRPSNWRCFRTSGTTRSNNEDFCGQLVEAPDAVVFRSCRWRRRLRGRRDRKQDGGRDPPQRVYAKVRANWARSKRLHRAIQTRQHRGLQLRLHGSRIAPDGHHADRGRDRKWRAATPPTSAIAGSFCCAAASITQMSKDHTMVGERVRMGLMSEERARNSSGSLGAAAQPRPRADRIGRSHHDAAAQGRRADSVQRRPLQRSRGPPS